jgi:hypothetical protein
LILGIGISAIGGRIGAIGALLFMVGFVAAMTRWHVVARIIVGFVCAVLVGGLLQFVLGTAR